ncbi:hypothetical protein KZZ52_15750 [Dactylosporangium sp. AC04546]|uniref:hypothetical protein n=1 Tax=Dactylosporangium sp. AC04546 TaxID=2862460 RepID=UPI001EE0B438|nr:hypothetical protein [Dactylosporangium sp. AC04546]WVK86760.1 hypothetical protein KZZ52_15750 [Dactylosporangium sp. AC04546]
MAELSVQNPEDRSWRERWVPVERRMLGLDRRTLLPAGLVTLLVVVAVWLLPAVDDAIAVDNPVRAGDVVQVGADVQFVPVAGANLVKGLRQETADAGRLYPGRATVTYAGATFTVIADRYDGSPAQLLEQIRKTNEGLRDNDGLRVSGDPVTLTNVTGQRGVVARFDGTSAKGLVAAFVFAGTGVEIVVLGPGTVNDSAAPALADMIRSVRPVQTGGGS